MLLLSTVFFKALLIYIILGRFPDSQDSRRYVVQNQYYEEVFSLPKRFRECVLYS